MYLHTVLYLLSEFGTSFGSRTYFISCCILYTADRSEFLIYYVFPIANQKAFDSINRTMDVFLFFTKTGKLSYILDNFLIFMYYNHIIFGGIPAIVCNRVTQTEVN